MTNKTIIGIVFIVAALLKLVDMWGILHLDWLWQQPWTKYFGPLLVLYLGVELVIYNFRNNRDQWLQRPVPIGEDGKRIYCSVRYGVDEYVFHGEPFHGARLDAFCGGIRMDLREAAISEDEEIDIHTFMGGVELFVPKNVNVVVKSRSFIGGVGNETVRSDVESAPNIYIIASNMFGGVSVKN